MSKFVKFAKNVWGISDIGKTADRVALEGIDALADFIKKNRLAYDIKGVGNRRQGYSSQYSSVM